ncbi:isoprenylcysteine carboxylmethyltransferase family protein [Candidatus Kirkpatrickella diaphorinae]|uniref:Isoprenylcysteine carboxylmethyltransferase family protein n=1 Tax=Candidatus Kirkpatrickella diaphorinae TaxID=2984322 RepID=A0ABY6GHZ1_9PROT|nr:isoprenylcysteine carboxylmethyltransferase family protein [Candidatus Kirkpatrickella diaphorinae]UYH51123.1 isoprenylcysteine carboxylmethyltransferase family protein [Candidatus Kirkpatrickella diaphorinae]
MIYTTPCAFAFSLFCFLSFTWALYRHFESPGQMPHNMRALSIFSLVAYVTFLAIGLLSEPGPWQVGGAIALFIASAIIFWSAVSATRKGGLHVAHEDAVSQEIVTRGPYRFLRHPFYVAYRLFWLATALIGGPVLWMFTLAFFVWYAILAREEEKRLLQSELGSSYKAYLSKRGLFKSGGFRHAETGTHKTVHASILARAMATFRFR